MPKKLTLKEESPRYGLNRFEKSSRDRSEEEFVRHEKELLINEDIAFYNSIGELLEGIGFEKTIITREGDTNIRFDATLCDYPAIPIEIKSPRETMYVNIKSIRQALENKVVLLSRNFYPTTKEAPSLAIGFEIPNERSDVEELMRDIKEVFDINIGVIDVEALLRLYHKVTINGESHHKQSLINLRGIYEEVKNS